MAHSKQNLQRIKPNPPWLQSVIQTNIPNCNYWPHYSFRPSIIDVSTILELGDYKTPNQFFEMDYAQRWVEAGYKSAFFNMITNRHIGKLTSERNDRNKLNAYELNNESQFVTKSPYIKIINLRNIFVPPKLEPPLTNMFK